MNQMEHIEQLMNESDERKEPAEQLQNFYLAYCKQKDTMLFDKIIEFSDLCYGRMVRKLLEDKGCYSVQNEEDILQEVRIAILEKIRADLEQGNIRKDFAFYVSGIYKIRTLNFIREFYRQKEKWGTIASLNEEKGENGPRIEETIKVSETEDGDEEKKEMFVSVLRIYCKSFLNYEAVPFMGLALYHARMLPHLLRINHEIKTIPETKKTSAKWAFENMGKRTVLQLKTDSEKILQEEISDELKWGEYFVKQLEEVFNFEGKEYTVKDVIYTEVYNKNKIEDWAEYMHKATVKTAKNELLKDRELWEMLKQYIAKGRNMHQLI